MDFLSIQCLFPCAFGDAIVQNLIVTGGYLSRCCLLGRLFWGVLGNWDGCDVVKVTMTWQFLTHSEEPTSIIDTPNLHSGAEYQLECAVVNNLYMNQCIVVSP